MATPARRRRLRVRTQLLRRWLALGALLVVGLLYVKPLRSYLELRETVTRRADEVRALERQRDQLRSRLAASSTRLALVRSARRLGYVAPGERLVIVHGIGAWQRARASGTRGG